MAAVDVGYDPLPTNLLMAAKCFLEFFAWDPSPGGPAFPRLRRTDQKVRRFYRGRDGSRTIYRSIKIDDTFLALPSCGQQNR